jgi:hypothetical protein
MVHIVVKFFFFGTQRVTYLTISVGIGRREILRLAAKDRCGGGPCCVGASWDHGRDTGTIVLRLVFLVVVLVRGKTR